jgi:hypothetical protein
VTDDERTAEWRRTDPDLRLYIPDEGAGRTASNQHVIVISTPEDSFVAVWKQASMENEPDQHVVASRSTDLGESWSDPIELDGPAPDDEP